MKKLLFVLLLLSLAANAALLFKKDGKAGSSVTSAANARQLNVNGSASSSRLPADLAAALASGDIAALKAAGFSDEDARAIEIGRAFSKLAVQMKVLRSVPPENEKKYWRNNSTNYSRMTSEQRSAMSKAQRDFQGAVVRVFGDDMETGLFGNARLGFLSNAKRDELRRIDEDYAEMTSEIYRQQEGIALPSDRAKIKLLQEEKERDIMAALSPEERELYGLYTSNTANTIRGRYGDAIQTEEQYRKIFALQKAFEQQFARDNQAGAKTSSQESRARTEAQRQLESDIRAVIGEEAYASYLRANDSDLRSLGSLQGRLNLPAGTAEQVYAMRDTYAAQSQAINANTALTPAQRREQFNALAAQAKNEMTGRLGQEGAEAYAQNARWLQMLKSGQAFSTNPKDAQPGFGGSTVYPVQPARKGEPEP